ncbi:hypothetical protein BGZ80_002491 [Entomortierella chlamydospora]|uniref:Uncharacterized protein n=1 Tax=Entomortierella chlamydospora TaxID=101097 RepID=A0A9P6MQ71_9FUNG|nr:hypothetical protein BGZ79_002016 [Entomortierella chlamydospora]KAG0009338.1 hypothetical protein BGZ80_002491 [Entomortierella chlamydospora]
MDGSNIPIGNISSLEAGIIIYAVLAASIILALIYFGRVFMARRRQCQRVMKDPDFEAGPPMYNQHFNDIPVDDQSCSPSTSDRTVTRTTFPPSALIRDDDYYIVTPRARNDSNSPYPHSHSRSGSGASGRSASPSNNNNNVVPVDCLPMTEVGVQPPAYEDLPTSNSSGVTTTAAAVASTDSNPSSSNP